MWWLRRGRPARAICTCAAAPRRRRAFRRRRCYPTPKRRLPHDIDNPRATPRPKKPPVMPGHLRDLENTGDLNPIRVHTVERHTHPLAPHSLPPTGVVSSSLPLGDETMGPGGWRSAKSWLRVPPRRCGRSQGAVGRSDAQAQARLRYEGRGLLLRLYLKTRISISRLYLWV